MSTPILTESYYGQVVEGGGEDSVVVLYWVNNGPVEQTYLREQFVGNQLPAEGTTLQVSVVVTECKVEIPVATLFDDLDEPTQRKALTAPDFLGANESDEYDEPEDLSEDDFARASNLIDKRVEEAILASGQTKVWVDYSAYDTDGNDVPIDNLDEVAVAGRVILIGHGDEFGKDYRSKILESPTWLQVAVCANEMIKTTGDTHHCYLEGLTKIGRDGDMTLYEFSMGS